MTADEKRAHDAYKWRIYAEKYDMSAARIFQTFGLPIEVTDESGRKIEAHLLPPNPEENAR